jgi:hypothetical protein
MSGTSATVLPVTRRHPEGYDADLDAARIRDTDAWPRFPWLPVKRGESGDSEVAWLYAFDIKPQDGQEQNVSIGLYEPTDETYDQLIGGRTIDGRQFPLLCEYGSVEAMLDDGWMID